MADAGVQRISADPGPEDEAMTSPVIAGYLSSGELARRARNGDPKPPTPPIFTIDHACAALIKCPRGLVRFSRWLRSRGDGHLLRRLAYWIGLSLGPHVTVEAAARAIERRVGE